MKEAINSTQSNKRNMGNSAYRSGQTSSQSDMHATIGDVAGNISTSAVERLRSIDVPAIFGTISEGVSTGAQTSYNFAKKYRYQLLAGVAAVGAMAMAYKMMGKRKMSLASLGSLGGLSLAGKTAKSSKKKSSKKK